jgi:hypothetical protein
MPPQFSEPQLPVAKAHVKVELFAGMALVTVWVDPVTADCCSPVFQFAVLVTSLNGLKKICADAVATQLAVRSAARMAARQIERANCGRVLMRESITFSSVGSGSG